jgi:hypothetical protein
MNPLDFALVAGENIGLESSFSLEALDSLRCASVDVVPPFLIVLVEFLRGHVPGLGSFSTQRALRRASSAPDFAPAECGSALAGEARRPIGRQMRPARPPGGCGSRIGDD